MEKTFRENIVNAAREKKKIIVIIDGKAAEAEILEVGKDCLRVHIDPEDLRIARFKATYIISFSNVMIPA